MPVDADTPEPIGESRDLGVMLWDIDFGTDAKGKARNRPIFFAAQLVQGILEIPADPESTLRIGAPYNGGPR
jgi:CRISPR-associated protein Cas5d